MTEKRRSDRRKTNTSSNTAQDAKRTQAVNIVNAPYESTPRPIKVPVPAQTPININHHHHHHHHRRQRRRSGLFTCRRLLLAFFVLLFYTVNVCPPLGSFQDDQIPKACSATPWIPYFEDIQAWYFTHANDKVQSFHEKYTAPLVATTADIYEKKVRPHAEQLWVELEPVGKRVYKTWSIRLAPIHDKLTESIQQFYDKAVRPGVGVIMEAYETHVRPQLEEVVLPKAQEATRQGKEWLAEKAQPILEQTQAAYRENLAPHVEQTVEQVVTVYNEKVAPIVSDVYETHVVPASTKVYENSKKVVEQKVIPAISTFWDKLYHVYTRKVYPKMKAHYKKVSKYYEKHAEPVVGPYVDMAKQQLHHALVYLGIAPSQEEIEEELRQIRAKQEAERRAREEAERKAREEAERKAREEAERKAREEAERKAREEAERKAREEAEAKAKKASKKDKEEAADEKPLKVQQPDNDELITEEEEVAEDQSETAAKKEPLKVQQPDSDQLTDDVQVEEEVSKQPEKATGKKPLKVQRPDSDQLNEEVQKVLDHLEAASKDGSAASLEAALKGSQNLLQGMLKDAFTGSREELGEIIELAMQNAIKEQRDEMLAQLERRRQVEGDTEEIRQARAKIEEDLDEAARVIREMLNPDDFVSKVPIEETKTEKKVASKATPAKEKPAAAKKQKPKAAKKASNKKPTKKPRAQNSKV